MNSKSKNVFILILQSEERGGTPSRRSKSEGPPGLPNGRCVVATDGVEDTKVTFKEKVPSH